MERHLRSPEYCDTVGHNMTPAVMHGFRYLLLKGRAKESSNRDMEWNRRWCVIEWLKSGQPGLARCLVGVKLNHYNLVAEIFNRLNRSWTSKWAQDCCLPSPHGKVMFFFFEMGIKGQPRTHFWKTRCWISGLLKRKSFEFVFSFQDLQCYIIKTELKLFRQRVSDIQPVKQTECEIAFCNHNMHKCSPQVPEFRKCCVTSILGHTSPGSPLITY